MARRDLKRGDVRWYRFSSPDKRRPVLILGRDSLLHSVSEVPVIPFSTQIRGLPWEVLLKPDEGLALRFKYNLSYSVNRPSLTGWVIAQMIMDVR